MSVRPAAPLRTLAAAALLALLASAARAENHALIMWIGDYGKPDVNLPGIDLDAANAKKIAVAMGVSPKNMTEISNTELTRANVKGALQSLHDRIKDGDKVFLYYSGHGAQAPAQGSTSAKCSEALVARDGLFFDNDMQAALTQLGNKASQVVMMNDSCFSGGAATRALAKPPADFKAKFLPVDAKANTAVGAGYSCGDPTNTGRVARSLNTMAKDARGPQVLYIAASNDTQVSFATSQGSLATLAWSACMSAANADTDRSGRINGAELQACAQSLIDKRGTKQTITIQGNAQLPLSFVKADADAAAAAPAPAPAAAPAAAVAVAAAPTPRRLRRPLRPLRLPRHRRPLRPSTPPRRCST